MQAAPCAAARLHSRVRERVRRALRYHRLCPAQGTEERPLRLSHAQPSARNRLKGTWAKSHSLPVPSTLPMALRADALRAPLRSSRRSRARPDVASPHGAHTGGANAAAPDHHTAADRHSPPITATRVQQQSPSVLAAAAAAAAIARGQSCDPRCNLCTARACLRTCEQSRPHLEWLRRGGGIHGARVRLPPPRCHRKLSRSLMS